MTTETSIAGHVKTPLLGTALKLSAVCFLLTLFCLELVVVKTHFPPLWLATPLMTAIAFRFSSRDSLPILLLCYLATTAANLLIIGPGFSALLFPLVNLVQALTGGFLLRLLLNRNDPFNSLLDWGKLVVSVGIITPFIGGLIALWLVNINGHASTDFFTGWVIAEIIGMLALGPVCLLWRRDMLSTHINTHQLFESLVVAIVSLAASYLALRFMPWPFTLIIVILFATAVWLPRFAAFVVFFLNSSMISLLLSLKLVDLQIVDAHYATAMPWMPFLLVLLPSHMMSLVMHAAREEKKHISENEVRFRHAMEYSLIGMAMVGPDGHWLRVNKALCQLLGYSAAELTRKDFQQLTHPDDVDTNVRLMQGVLAGEHDSYKMEKRYFRKDGEIVWALLGSSLVRDAQNIPLYFISQIEDITELKRSEEVNRLLMERITQANAALFQEKERMHITLHSIGEAVISTDKEMRVTFMNPVAERMSGWSQKEAAGKKLSDILLISQGEGGPRNETLLLSELPTDKTTPGFEEDLILHNGSEERFEIHYSITPLKTQEGENIGTVMVIRDVSDSREMLRRLSYSASHDTLTHLPNRANFEHRLKRLLQEAGEQQQQHVLVFIDLDRFKAVNDTAGHAAGDALLRELSGLMLHNLRGSDFLARLGGDEFGLLMPQCRIDDARVVVQNIVNAINDYALQWEGCTYHVGASAGMTQIDGQNCVGSEVMSQADAACYRAKHNGRGQLQVYEAQQLSVVSSREIDLQTLDQLQLRLLTWAVAPPHRTLSVSFYLLEVERIPEQHDSGDDVNWRAAMHDAELQVAFDRKVIAIFFQQYAESLARKGITLAIPLSPASVSSAAFIDDLLQQLENSLLSASHLWFAIDTETLLNGDNACHLNVATLRARGCRILMQNFGRNLDNFNQFNPGDVDFLMMSPDLIANVHCNLMDEMLVSIIHGQAEQRQIATIAGPVEHPAGLSTLATSGINMAWGKAVGKRESLSQLMQNSYFAIK